MSLYLIVVLVRRSFNDKLPQQVSQLPDYQFNALNSCLSQVIKFFDRFFENVQFFGVILISIFIQMKWLMKDEIVTFMLDSSPVTSDILKMVCDHIELSSNASTCFIEKVPLSFVFGKQTTCINNFLQVSLKFKTKKTKYLKLKC